MPEPFSPTTRVTVCPPRYAGPRFPGVVVKIVQSERDGTVYVVRLDGDRRDRDFWLEDLEKEK